MDIEFKPHDLKFEYNLERIIDDFILFCVLVGNDFLPCLPFAEIGESGLDDLFRVYKDHLASASTSPWLTKDCGEVDFKQLLVTRVKCFLDLSGTFNARVSTANPNSTWFCWQPELERSK